MMVISFFPSCAACIPVAMLCKEPHQQPAMFPVQFIYILDISVGKSFQTYLVGPIFLSSFPFILCLPIQFFILNLYLLGDRGTHGSCSVALILGFFLASPSVVSFCVMPLCLGVYTMDTRFLFDKAVNFSVQSATSSDLVTLTASAVIAT